MWLRRPEYRATPQSVFAKVQEFARPRVVGRDALLRDRMPTNMARYAKYPRRPRRVALWGVSRRSGSWRRRNGRGASFPAIGVSILPEKKGGGRALMARIPPVADTDGTDLALPLEVARRSVLSVTAKPEPSFPPTFQDEISVRNKSNCQSSSITAETAPRERILFHKWSHRGSELRFLRRISHRNPWPLFPHISNTFRVFSDGLRPFSVFCGKNSPTSLPRLRPGLNQRAEGRREGGGCWGLVRQGFAHPPDPSRGYNGRTRRAMYPRRPRRVAPERLRSGRVAFPRDRF